LKNEIKVLCAEADVMNQRSKDLEEAFVANPNAKFRLKIKTFYVSNITQTMGKRC